MRVALDSPISAEEHLALLEITSALASHTNLQDLLQMVRRKLHDVLPFTYMSVLIYDPERDVMRMHTLETSGPASIAPGSVYSMESSPAAQVWMTQSPFVVTDVASDQRYPEVMRVLLDHDVHSVCILPLTTPRRRFGTLTLGLPHSNGYAPERLELPRIVAAQVAIALENSISYQEAQRAQQQAVRERDRLRLLLDVNNAVVANLAPAPLFDTMPRSVRSAMRCDAVALSLPDQDMLHVRIHGIDFPESRGYLELDTAFSISGSSAGRAFSSGKTVVWQGEPSHALDALSRTVKQNEDFKSGCFIPLVRNARKLGVLHLLDRRPEFFSAEDIDFLQQLANQLAIALENAIQFQDVFEATTKLQEETHYLRQELRSERGFGEILGESPAIRRVISQIQTVAPTGSTVFISGETGTGKELVARAIHNLSSRRDHSFIKLNCAAIPLGLLESELFGHERGAFTGAISQKIGRFELANKGTLFLDEVGDIPLELQAKLLRVLQEQEFERLGSNRTIRVDVRLLAATNRNLAQMVERGEFRADLYYRLNVFPIFVAPLRERREDIPLLVHHFVAKFAHRMSRRIDTIPAEMIRALTEYNWPGNIRELQNFLERAVILSQSHILHAPLAELRSLQQQPAPAAHKTKDEAEREHILTALRECDWKLSGPSGAAARLGVPRTTLLYRMKKLDISRSMDA